MWDEFDPLKGPPRVAPAAPIMSKAETQAQPVFSTPGSLTESDTRRHNHRSTPSIHSIKGVLGNSSDGEREKNNIEEDSRSERATFSPPEVINASESPKQEDIALPNTVGSPEDARGVQHHDESSIQPPIGTLKMSSNEATVEPPSEAVAKTSVDNSLVEPTGNNDDPETPTSPSELPKRHGSPPGPDNESPAEGSITPQAKQSPPVPQHDQPNDTSPGHASNRNSPAKPRDEPQEHEGALRRSSIATMRQLGEPVEGEDQPQFDFQAFLNLMRHRTADPIARYIKSFLQEFCKKAWTPEQQEKIVADFHRFIIVKMRQFEPFASLSPPQMYNASEGMEKLVMNRLYVRVFPPKMAPILRRDGHDEDLLRDQMLMEKMRLWGWVEGHHLDINDEYLQPHFLRLASVELARLHQFRAPRDKMICVLNCSKVVWALIRQVHLEQNADSFLPLLIYVVLKAQPQHLVSNINYIQRFRAPEYRQGETAYYLSTLASAVAFIEGLDKTSLTITDAEFEERIDQAAKQEGERRLKEEAASQESAALPSPQSPQPDDDLGFETVLATSAGMIVDRVKSLTSKMFEPENEELPSEPESQNQQSAPQSRRNHGESQEERAARLASAEEYRAQKVREQEFAQTLESLESMFPVLDKEVIEDVLREKGTNVGSAVDVCLALVGSS